jgi:hypothetical protein
MNAFSLHSTLLFSNNKKKQIKCVEEFYMEEKDKFCFKEEPAPKAYGGSKENKV